MAASGDQRGGKSPHSGRMGIAGRGSRAGVVPADLTIRFGRRL